MKNSCEPYQEMVQLQLDRELDGASVEALIDHLDDCSDCRAFRRGLRRAADVFVAVEGARAEPDLPGGFADEVAARFIDGKSLARPKRKRIVAMAGALAASLVIAVVSFFGIERYRAPKEPARVSLNSISLKSDSIGIEIGWDRFFISSKDKEGKSGVDLKF